MSITSLHDYMLTNGTLPDYMLKNGSLLFPFAPDRTYEDFQDFLAAYCINPSDDVCFVPPGLCRNSDAAGILVRVAAYGSNFFISTLILYDPKKAYESFWSLMLFIYSLLITTTISIYNRTLTKFHSQVAANLAGSPVLCLLFVYVIIGLPLFSKRLGDHRMKHVLGGGLAERLVEKLAVIGAVGLWLFVVGFTIRNSNKSFFRQSACTPFDLKNQIALTITILPYAMVIIVIWNAVLDRDATFFIDTIPLVALITIFIITLFLRRNTIKALRNGKFEAWTAWRYFSRQYAFLHFLGVVGLSFIYWIYFVEAYVSDSHDNHFELSFGQILAVFSVVQPLVQNIRLLPRLWIWFIDLTWVRFLTRRSQKKSGVRMLYDDIESLEEWKSSKDGSPERIPLRHHITA